jgi:hypothetical protein
MYYINQYKRAVSESYDFNAQPFTNVQPMQDNKYCFHTFI